MSAKWAEVAIGEVADPVHRPVQPVPGETYRQVGVRWWGGGVYEREPVDGANTRYATFDRLEAGDIIFNKIWARHGGISVVQPSLTGCYCSGEFPLFRPRENLLSPNWFYWITKARWFWERCDLQSRGTSGKNRIRPEKFVQIRIPLPSLAEQRRIVEKIERLVAKVEEACDLLDECTKGAGALWTALLLSFVSGRRTPAGPRAPGTTARATLLAAAAAAGSGGTGSKHNNAHPERPEVVAKGPHPLPRDWVWTTLGSVLTHLVDCVNDTPDFAETDTGFLGLKSTNVRPYRLDLTSRWFVTEADFRAWNRREVPRPGDVLLTREAPMGLACLLPAGLRVCITQRLMLLRPNPDVVLPEFVVHYLNSDLFHGQVADQCRGLTTPHIRVQDMPLFLFALPPRETQQRIVARLAAMRNGIEEANREHEMATARFRSIMGGVFDRAFSGALC